MQAAKELERFSVEEYLVWESKNEIRHEYIGGMVYAMAGATEEHNLITGNIFAALHGHLRGKPCRLFSAEMKVRLEISNTDILYYPDLFVTCDSGDTHRFYKRSPKLVIEVLSESTERIDRQEKFTSYIQIPSLEEYVLVDQDRMEVTVFRRANNWQAELLTRADESLKLSSLDFTLPLSAIYEGVRVK